MLTHFLAAYCLGFLIGGGIAAYCGHYWGRRPPSWRTDGSQEGAA